MSIIWLVRFLKIPIFCFKNLHYVTFCPITILNLFPWLRLFCYSSSNYCIKPPFSCSGFKLIDVVIFFLSYMEHWESAATAKVFSSNKHPGRTFGYDPNSDPKAFLCRCIYNKFRWKMCFANASFIKTSIFSCLRKTKYNL